MKKYTIGVDYGSLSGRGVLVDTADGRIAAEAVMSYPHGAMNNCLPDGTPLPAEWVVQHPADFRQVLHVVVPELLKQSGVSPEQVVGIGIDFTSATVVALDEQLRPLCEQPEYASVPHAWPKMWKHHAAAAQAKRLTQVAKEQGRPYPERHGGSIPSESMIPKVVQTLQEAPEVYDKIACFMEAGDYLTSWLVGGPVRSLSMAAARALWLEDSGYPDNDFLCAVDPGLKDMPKQKLADRFPNCVSGYPGQKVGVICQEAAQELGIPAGIAVSAPQMDAYAAFPGIGIAEPGIMMLVMGTSTAILMMGEKKNVEGITACVPDIVLPGHYGYGSGQSSVGDCFQWCIENCVPEAYAQEAKRLGISLHQYLSQLAAPLKPGQTGLIALDWLNGNKSCLANSKLSGMILGLNMKTKPEHIYRALQEATAFGCRVIVEAYEKSGVPVKEIVACGGIAGKNPVLVQMYTDILGKPLRLSRCTQGPALGSAIYAAAAAGEQTGYEDIYAAIRGMSYDDSVLYIPNLENQRAYEELYQWYVQLHDYFGRENRQLMEYFSDKRHI